MEQSMARDEVAEMKICSTQEYVTIKSEKEIPQLNRKDPNNCPTFPRTIEKIVAEQSAQRSSWESCQLMEKADSKQCSVFIIDGTKQVDRCQQSHIENGYICERNVVIKCNGDRNNKTEKEIEENHACVFNDRDLPIKATNVKCYGTPRKTRTIELKERDITEMEITRSRLNGFNRKQKTFTRNDSEISSSIVNTETPIASDPVGYHEEKENRANKRVRSKETEPENLSTTNNRNISTTHYEIVNGISKNDRGNSGVTAEAENSEYVNAEIIHHSAHCSHNNVKGNIELNASDVADEKVNRTTQGDDGSHRTTDGCKKAHDVTPNLRGNAHNTLSHKNSDEASSGYGYKVKRSVSDVATCHKRHKQHVECSRNKGKRNPPLQCVSDALQERSYLLQCCRFIVNNSCLQQKPPAVLKHFPWVTKKAAPSQGVLLGQTATFEDCSVEEKIDTVSESTEITKKEDIRVAPSSKEPENIDVERRYWEAGNSSVDNNKDSFDIDGLTEDASLASVLLLQDFTDHEDQDIILEQASCKNDSQLNDVSRPGFSSENRSFIGRLAEGTALNDTQNQPILDWLASSGQGQSCIPFKSHSQHNESSILQSQSAVDKLSVFMHPYFLMDSSVREGERETQACSWRQYYNDMGDYYHSSHDVMLKHRGLRQAATLNELIADAKYASMMSNIYNGEDQHAIPLLLDQHTGTHLSLDDIDNQDITSLGDDEDDISQYINFDLHGTESGICYD